MHRAEIEAIVGSGEEPGFANVIEALDRSGRKLARISAVFSLVNRADSNDELQALDTVITPLLSAHYDYINLNEPLFGKIRQVYENRNGLGLTALQMRLTEKIYERFVRSGALLEGAKKERLKSINGELAVLSMRFGNNVLAENKNFGLVISDASETLNIPADIRSAAVDEAKKRGLEDKWVFTLSKPSMIPFLTYSTNREYRRQIYQAYLNRGNNNDQYDNKAIVNDIVRLRLEKANLLGYPSHAAYVLDINMAENADNVYALLDRIWSPALKLASGELEELRSRRTAEGNDGAFESWDWWLYAEKVRRERYDLNVETVRDYFALEDVTRGIFDLCNRLWGISFRPVSVPVYNNECLVYEVMDGAKHMGIVYFDFHPRPGKSPGAWCGSFRPQSYENGVRVAPVITIVCNFTRPAGSSPALLTLEETETFFHEFGHALHGLFSDVPYDGLRGVERDFVELPSQIMENWAFEPQVLKMYARQYRTGEVIPDDLIHKIRRAALFNQGFVTTELTAAAYSDMDIHTLESFSPLDVNGFEYQALTVKRGLIREIEPRYRYPYFSHIFDGGYSAGYYGYLWAEVLDKDAYEAFVESGDIFNRKIAAAFRDKILSRGGTADGMDLYRNFRGKDPDPVPMMVGRGLMARPEPKPEPVIVPPAADTVPVP